ncbi:MAG: hypothetical protein HKN57_11235 [Xanthomonadales bacterium]|nr:hypothetical protein [Gammaproteobacteria bacterium]NND57810.1 hypothetical protein [Xanthomonadales bacterium]NNK51459.1 hypothetical protein [Xanthomonadales bacterium]
MSLAVLLLAVPAHAQQTEASPLAPVSLQALAARADAVVLAQVRDTDYLRRRDIPVSGSAYLKVLIPYKTDRSADLIEVYEKGLHDHECYFPNPTVFEEGRRYLLFLRRDEEDPERYRGMPEGCALDVLVADDNRYVLRYPVTGVALSDPLEEMARPVTFGDGYAVVDEEDLLPQERDRMLNAGQIRRYGEGEWIYTTGVDLAEARRLIGVEALLD